jgi:hypothetical protein
MGRAIRPTVAVRVALGRVPALALAARAVREETGVTAASPRRVAVVGVLPARAAGRRAVAPERAQEAAEGARVSREAAEGAPEVAWQGTAGTLAPAAAEVPAAAGELLAAALAEAKAAASVRSCWTRLAKTRLTRIGSA